MFKSLKGVLSEKFLLGAVNIVWYIKTFEKIFFE